MAQQAKVDSDKAALDACNANPPVGGCSSKQTAYTNDLTTLNSLKSSLSSAQSNLATAKSSVATMAVQT